MDELKKKIGKWPGGKILDVATGHGGFIPLLREFFPNYEFIVGIDLSPYAIDDVRRKYSAADKIKFAVMDAAKLALKNVSFEIAAITDSLHHLKNIDAVLKEMKRALKPGGLFLIFEMFKDDQNEIQKSHVMIHHWWAEIDRLDGYIHNETFTRNQIKDIAKRIGLRELDFIELSEPGSVDESVIERIKSTCDDYLAKIRDRPGCDELSKRGEKLKKRIDDIGFAWAKTLCVVGRK